MTWSPNKPAPSKNVGSKLVFYRNDNSKLASKKNDSNNKVNRFGIDRNNIKYVKKLRKLFKLGKLKSEKMSKSWNLAKLEKKVIKIRNSANSNITKIRQKFLISNTRITFNCLWFAFIKAPILWHFDSEYHI